MIKGKEVICLFVISQKAIDASMLSKSIVAFISLQCDSMASVEVQTNALTIY